MKLRVLFNGVVPPLRDWERRLLNEDFFAVVGIDVKDVVGFQGDLPGYRPQ